MELMCSREVLETPERMIKMHFSVLAKLQLNPNAQVKILRQMNTIPYLKIQ